jgi:hypothetical protein
MTAAPIKNMITAANINNPLRIAAFDLRKMHLFTFI